METLMRKTVIKRTLIVVLSLFAAGVAGYGLSNLVHDKPVAPDQLPEKAVAFINEHFTESVIAFSKQDRDFLKVSYEVVLTDGTKIEFRRGGEWKEIDRHHERIPDGIIPQDIATKILELYPNSFATKVENDSRHIEVELNNRLELKFDKNHNLIGIDR